MCLGSPIDQGNEIAEVKPEEWRITPSTMLQVVAGTRVVLDSSAVTDAEARAHTQQKGTAQVHTRLTSSRREQTNRITQKPTHKYIMEAKPSDYANLRLLQFLCSNDPTFYLPFPSHIPTPVYEPWKAIHASHVYSLHILLSGLGSYNRTRSGRLRYGMFGATRNG